MTQTPASNSDADGVSPPSSEAPPVGTELRESAQDPLDIAMQRADALDQRMLWDGMVLSVPRDMVGPREMVSSSSWTYEETRRAAEQLLRNSDSQGPTLLQETWTSRKLRRASGDRRTVKQIVAEQRREER